MPGSTESQLSSLLQDIGRCDLCASHLPLGPRPVLRASPSARILVAGQAPGIRVHETGIPFNDPSGDRLRQWMGIDRDTFYDDSRIAIIPMGFCYPGSAERGDLPPRPECARQWHSRLLPLLPDIELTLAIGAYAHRFHLGSTRRKSLTETVRCWRDYQPGVIPLPHPSPRNNGWLKQNPWFQAELMPVVAERVAVLLGKK